MYGRRQNIDAHYMPGARYTQLAERAAETFGYITGEDARALGVPMGTLSALARRGQLERVDHGIYRVPLIPPSRLDQYMLATLWPDRRGRISHESALDLYGVSDVNPEKIHVTVPAGYRTHRAIPALYALHREDLPPADQDSFEGVPVVTAAKAIRQIHGRDVRRSLIEQAIDEAARGGWLRQREAAQLRLELLTRPAA
jgi:predicted transcriptional regulator of viral defense system